MFPFNCRLAIFSGRRLGVVRSRSPADRFRHTLVSRAARSGGGDMLRRRIRRRSPNFEVQIPAAPGSGLSAMSGPSPVRQSTFQVAAVP